VRHKLEDIADQFEKLYAADLDREAAIAEFDRIIHQMNAGVLVNRAAEAFEVAEKLLAFAEELDHDHGVAHGLAYSGFALYLLSNHEQALERLTKALPIMKRLGDEDGMASVYSGMAGTNLSLGNYELALENGLECLRLSRNTGNRHLEAWSLQGLGQGYTEFGDYPRALEYHQESLAVFKALNDQIGYGRALSGLGSVYQIKGELDRALDFHTQALDLFRDVDNSLGLSRVMHDIGQIKQAQGEFDTAEQFLLDSLKLREEIGNRQSQSTSMISLGSLYTERGEPDRALQVLHRALSIAMEIKAKPRVFQANKALSDVYESIEEYDNALLHYKEYQRVKEEVQGDVASTRLRNLQVQYETEKSQQEAEINRLRNVELHEKNEQLQQLLNEVREAQHQLVQSEKMAALGSLVAGVVHELNSPLGALSSLGQVTRRALEYIRATIETSASFEELQRDPKFARSLQVLQDNNQVTLEASERISRIVSSLKSFSRLDRAKYEEFDVHEGLESTLTLLEHEFKDRITVDRQFGDVPRLMVQPGELNQVFMNLLSNAAQAIESEGRIAIKTWCDNGHATIRISDTGRGIAPEQMKSLFDPGFSKSGSRVKAGMGLFTSYNIIEKHQGEFKAESEIGKGTTFTISLPVGREQSKTTRA